jgi:hypothetical protein
MRLAEGACGGKRTKLYIWRFPRSTTKNSRRLMRYACVFFVLAQTLMGFSRKGKFKAGTEEVAKD